MKEIMKTMKYDNKFLKVIFFLFSYLTSAFFVLKFLLDNEPSFVIDYTRNGNPKPESYDKADSIVIARAGAICEQKNSK